MRYLSANCIFPLHISPIKEGVVQVSSKGEVVNVFSHRSQVPSDKLEVFEGLLLSKYILNSGFFSKPSFEMSQSK